MITGHGTANRSWSGRHDGNGPVPRTATLRQGLPDRLARALVLAQAGERAAAGAQRIPAFRLTRALLGGARVAGYPTRDLARCLGTTVNSVLTRSYEDGWITAGVFAQLADLDQAVLARWQTGGLLPSQAHDEDGRPCHLASELIRALEDVDG